jgi:hypothetical protein
MTIRICATALSTGIKNRKVIHMVIRNCIVAVSVSLLGACAASSPPASAPGAVTVASAGVPANGVTEAQQQQFNRLASRLGYHVEMVNSERHYCKSQEVTESRLAHKECLNENQMAAKIKSGDDSKASMPPMNGGVITRQPSGH